jgi:hypothetical protein
MQKRGKWWSNATPCVALVLFGAACSNGTPDAPAADLNSRPTLTVTAATPTTGVSVVNTLATPTMRTSWRDGCPVPLANLRYITLTYWGYDEAPHMGELVVSAAHADAVVTVFAVLFDARFPVERMQLVDDFGGDDKASMRANNTSAFNCREVDGRPGVLSAHSWGTAIDINPLVNPWVRAGDVDPPEGAPYADRTQPIRGGIFAGDVVVRAFRDIGWTWGGDWPTSKDWQHFSATGN